MHVLYDVSTQLSKGLCTIELDTELSTTEHSV
jgi:hypothetical protein